MTDSTPTSNPVPSIELRAGAASVRIPQLGYGVWQVDADEAATYVGKALDAGYRHVDTAKAYENESGVGEAIDGRDDVFVTTKLWNDDQGADQTRAAFEASAKRLRRTERPVDLYLIHWPTPAKDTFVETYRTMIELRDEGKVRAIGVCNFRIEDLQRLKDETGEFPAINQIELHPHFNQQQLRDFHAANGIVTEAWSPLGQGGEVLQDDTIAAIAEEHRKNPAQVILRWHLQHGNVVIPKSTTPERIVSNFDVFDFELTDEQMERIDALSKDDGRLGPDPADFND